MPRKILFASFIVAIMTALNFIVGQAQTTNSPRLTTNYPEISVREGPGIDYPVIETIGQDIAPGEFYPIIGHHGSWWLIKLDPIESASPSSPVGWVNTSYIIAVDVKSVPTIGTCAFPNHIAPTCPMTQDIIKLTYQPFEHGIMLWNPSGYITMLSNSCAGLNPYYLADIYRDTWSGEALLSQIPPSGLHQPQHGFGKVWLDHNLRQRLGWATSGERTYTTPIEYEYGAHPHDYFYFPQRQIIMQGGYSIGGYFWSYLVNGKASECIP